MLPISKAHPVIENPMALRPVAALPAAGAWDAAPAEFAIAGYDLITVYGTYERGGAGGAVDVQAEASPYAADLVAPAPSWFMQSLLAAGVLAAGADVQSREQREFVTYQATAAGLENFVVGVLRGEGVERIRLRCRESGAVATPGNMTLTAVGSMDA